MCGGLAGDDVSTFFDFQQLGAVGLYYCDSMKFKGPKYLHPLCSYCHGLATKSPNCWFATQFAFPKRD